MTERAGGVFIADEIERIDAAARRLILHGGAEKMIEAGCVVIGGHSVGDNEIKFGYEVTGVVKQKHI